MKIAIMQPYFFPYIGYFQLINAVEKFIIYDDVNYMKKGWINRNNILVNSSPSLFTIPLQRASQNRLIKDICVSDENSWREKLIKTIELNYKKAPFFVDVFPLIKKIILFDEKKISKLILFSLKEINRYLNIKSIIVETSDIYNNQYLKAQERIIDICKKEHATQYLNPIGGLEMYSEEVFAQNGIKLNFLKVNPIVYKQFNNEFVSWLSILDVLMFNSKNVISSILEDYELV